MLALAALGGGSVEMTGETIYALSSGIGAAGVAVIRVSGPRAGAVIDALTDERRPAPRKAGLRKIVDPRNGEMVDRGLILWFPGPGSFTGEDVAEFHVHGGRAVTGGLFEAIAGVDGTRAASPGEFSRRAFEHGRLDLTAAEAIGDLVNAETAAQRRQALRQMDGALGALYEAWRNRLTAILAHLEAAIDFADEDLPDDVIATAQRGLGDVTAEIGRHLDDGARGQRIRDGYRIAIVGAPNVGKSSLLNRLARRDAAIVAASAGTTRDVVEVALDLGGYWVTVADTAGLRRSADDVEREGVRRAQQQAATADLQLIVIDATAPDETAAPVADFLTGAAMAIANKCDIVDGPSVRLAGQPVAMVSALTGTGLAELEDALAERVAAELASESPALTRLRHRESLTECDQALRRAVAAGDVALVAEDVRLAVRAIGRITGRVDVEDLLDIIFSEFCIGK